MGGGAAVGGRRRRGPPRVGPGTVLGDGQGPRRQVRRDHPRAVAAAGHFRRLGAPPVHHGPGPQPRRPHHVRQPLPQGLGLPPRAHHQLVHPLRHRPFRPGSRLPGHRRQALLHSLPAGRRPGVFRDRRVHPPRDDARRHRRRRSSRGPTLRRRPGPQRRVADHGPGDSGGGRRGYRPGVRHGRPQGNPRQRHRGLRDRAPPRPGIHRHHRAGRRPDRGGWQVRRRGAVRGPPLGRSRSWSGWAAWRRSRTTAIR